MSDQNFEDLFTPQRLKEMAIIDIRIATKTCKESGYPKQKLIELARMITKFKKDFPAAPELESLERIAVTIIEKLEKIKSEPQPEPKKPDVPKFFISERFPPIIPSPLPPEVLYNTSVIESKNRYNDNTMLIYSPFEDELIHLCKCYASKTEKLLRIVDFRDLLKSCPHEISRLLSQLFDHLQTSDKEVMAFLGVEALAENEANAATLWEYVYKMRRTVQRDARESGRTVTELFILSTDLDFGIESRYNSYIKSEYTHDDVVDNYLYNIVTDYLPLVSKEKTVSVLRQRFGITDDDESTLEAIAKNGIFLGWCGLTEIIKTVGSAEELCDKLLEMKNDKKKILDDFIAISNLGLSRFTLLDWNYSTKKTKKEESPVIDPEDPVLNPHYTLKGRSYDEFISNSEISERLERLLNVTDVPLLPRCAWAADFAMKGGDQLNLENIPPEKEESFLTLRWDLAAHAVARLLLLEIPKLVFDIGPNETMRGQCCDNGGTLRMSKRFLKKENVDEGIGTLLHEFFHAIQFRAEFALYAVDEAKRMNQVPLKEEQDVLNYYYYHLNISQFHVQQWAQNFSRYRSMDSAFEDYYDQVVEAEARIFSADAISKNGQINHPRLDEDVNL